MKFENKIFYFMKYVAVNPRRLVNFVMKRFPHTVMVEPVSFCNLKCPLCPTPYLKRERGSMEIDNYKKIVNEVSKFAFHIRLWGWGEPLLHKDIFEMIKYAKKKKMYVNLSTNATFLTKEKAKKLIESKIDNIIVSMDGVTPEVYEKYRKKGNFEGVLEGVAELSLQKKIRKSKSKITLQFIIMKHNEHQVKDFIKLAKKHGVDFQTKTVGAMVPENLKEIKKYLPKNPKYNRYIKGGIKSQKPMCLRELFILQDGKVSVCCNDAYGQYIMGDIKKENIKDIWKKKEYINFRKAVGKRKINNPMCNLCLSTKKTHAIKV